MRCSAAILVLAALAFGTWGAAEGPTFSICYPHYKYLRAVDSLSAVDFHNFNLILFDDDGRRMLLAKLQDGTFEHKYKVGGDWVKVASIQYWSPEKTGPPKALLRADYVETGASSSDFGLVQVFELTEGHPVVLQQILFNTRGEGADSAFDSKKGVLKIRGVHGWEHCCPTTLDVGTFKWNGSGFALTESKSIPMPSAQPPGVKPR